MLMRTDIQPLCPVHKTNMQLTTVGMTLGSEVELKPCYGCIEVGCLYHYSVVQGYFAAREGEQLETDSGNRQECPSDGVPMFLVSIALNSSSRAWRCGVLGCPGYIAEETSAAGSM